MNQGTKFGMIAAGALSLLASASALAAPITITYTGTVASGTDELGLFGAPGSSLAGSLFTVQYLVNTTLPGSTRSTVAGDHDSVSGGPLFGTTSPLTSATITIGSGMQTLGSNSFSDFGVFTYLTGQYYESNTVSNPFTPAGGGATLNYENVVFDNYVDPSITSIDQSFINSNLVGNGAGESGHFDFFGTLAGGGALNTTGVFAPGGTLVVSASVVPMPEMSTWMMLIVGFGAVGLTQRRRTRVRYVTA
jgi:hypothetical protein